MVSDLLDKTEKKNILPIGFSTYRYFMIFEIVLVFLFFVIITHFLLRKCLRKTSAQPQNNEIANNDLEVEQVEHIVDTRYLLFITVANLFIYGSFYLPTQILPFRFSLALQDFSVILSNPLLMSFFYIRNPNIWNFVLKKLFRGSSVQPTPQEEIQLQNL